MKMKLIIGGGALLLILIAVGATLFLTGGLGGGGAPQEGGNKAAEPVQVINRFNDAQYFSLKPEFLGHFGGRERPRYLQVEVSVSTFDPLVIPAIQQHMPVMRDRLTSLFSNRDRVEMQTQEGKETLREEVLELIHEIMIERFGNKGVEEVFFNKFVLE